MAKTIVGLYDDAGTAQQVLQAIEDEGFDANQAHLVSHGSETGTATRSQGGSEGDVVSMLTDRGVPTEEAHLYAEGLRRGGSLVIVHTPDDRAEEAAGILGLHRPVSLPERQSDWEERGYTGYNPEAEPYAREEAEAERARYREEGTAEEAEEEVRLPIVEERVKVGKRAVEQGGIRIHSHVEERPVEEQVRLRDEEVDVERRKTDRALSEEEADAAFQDQDVEMTETDEEAVVEKEARVTEEVVAHKRATEREETVRDTERRTEVDVKDTGDYEEDADDRGRS